MKHSRSPAWLPALLLSGVIAAGCGTDPIIGPGPQETATFVGAGDIGVCNSPAPFATGRLLDGIPGTVFTTGDNAYPVGSRENFRDCYDPAWGHHKDRTRPTPGNHEYDLGTNAAPYFEYFGLNAGSAARSYYSFRIGSWMAYALDSNISMALGSAQARWLREELAAQPRTQCAVAYWHHPLYSSGPHRGALRPREVWSLLYDAGVELVLNGHEHLYERFAPQNFDGQLDSGRGIRQFTIGTGGALLSLPGARVANSERILSEFGVLKLSLEPASYGWEFIGTNGTVRDSGRGVCH